MNLFDMLSYTVKRLPYKTALICDDRTVTYTQLRRRALSLAAHLRDRGLSKGDRVALLMPNCIEFVVSYFACTAAGFIVVPLNSRLAARELAYALNNSRAEVLIAGYQFWDVAREILAGANPMKALVYAGEEEKEGAEWFDRLTAMDLPPEPPGPATDDPACILYTSGTTGFPKGAVMTHRNILVNARNCGAHMGYREHDVTLCVVPLFHVTGLNSQLIALTYAGGTCVIMKSYNTAAMIELVERHKITALVGVPTIFTLMLVNDALDRHDLSSLRMAAYGGAPMDPQTIASLQERLGVDLYNIYGLTETSSLTTVLPACDAVRKAGSVGLGVSGIRLRVVNEEGEDVPADDVGELYVQGPNVVSGYWGDSGSRAAFSEGWLKTGDYARIDEEGFVFIVDRKKDMINRGGENVYSIEVEAALVAHPGVLEAAVVPRPHSIFGEVVHAFVVRAPGTDVSEEAIIEHCRLRIADYKVPASVSFVGELPRNPGGKVLKKHLREMVPSGDPPRR